MFRFCFLLFLISLSLHAVTCACTIPVFRYALDRWETDRYRLTVPASTAQDAALTELLRPLRANGKANLDIVTAKDAAITEAELLDAKTGAQSLWKGALNAEAVAAVLDSPVRQQIRQRILAGESVIWVIVEAGKAEDAAEIERIEKRLRFLDQVAALPIQDPNDPDSQLGPGPALRLKFTTLRLRADDPAEKLLTAMLAGPVGVLEPKQSFAAAVFGKGRVLGAWSLSRLDDATLEEACMFLVGRCSCRVKNDNPGWDLLLNVDWPLALAEAGNPQPDVTAAAPQGVKMSQPEAAVPQLQAPEPVIVEPIIKTEKIPQGPILMSVSALLLGLALWLIRKKD